MFEILPPRLEACASNNFENHVRKYGKIKENLWTTIKALLRSKKSKIDFRTYPKKMFFWVQPKKAGMEGVLFFLYLLQTSQSVVMK